MAYNPTFYALNVAPSIDNNNPCIATYTPGSSRNNYTGFVGFSFTVGASNISVTSLGRVFLTGNSGTATVKLVVHSTGNDVSGGSATISLSSGTNNQFNYTILPTAVTLTAGTTYYCVSSSTNGGNSWYDSNTVVNSTSAGVAVGSIGAVYGTGPGAWTVFSTDSHTYVPPNFKFV